ncbi:DUF4260 domain-containing protein [Agromyces humatus]|uniref:DUF4260 domain-containing protein n=1 Tax=Agromyces humatus TaxID=279573 RepID=A0ABN2KMR2_9MICO|nr:DUF4260 domain-containing protein [Agromyces humatus]
MSTSTDATAPRDDTRDGVNAVQRLEGGMITALSITATLIIDPALWWMPLATFLLFDLSMLGYVRSPAAGAITYNLVHNYAGPAALGVVALALTATGALPALATWSGIIASAWAFHVGVDRMLGYGLKLPDAFGHTHMGWIGRRPERRVSTASNTRAG